MSRIFVESDFLWLSGISFVPNIYQFKFNYVINGGSVMAAKCIRPPKHYSCIKNCRHTSVKANGNEIKMKPAACHLQAVSIRCEKICNIQHYSFGQLFICHWVQLPFRNLVPAVTVPPTPASNSTLSSAACNRGGGECLLAIKQPPNDITACQTAQIRERRPSMDR